MSFRDLLLLMNQRNASDLYLTVGAPPTFKIDGKSVPVGSSSLKPMETVALAREMMSEEQLGEFETHKELNMALSVPQVGRFRVNAFYQRNEVGMVLRSIKTDIPQLENLRLPPILRELAMTKRGLILFVGATGSGKSTSLAAMVGYRNRHDSGHILTIEDPIEFLHRHEKSIVNQREVGIDTASYEEALKNALRQAPDVILIGEIRARETMEHAVAFAETGHLCLSTLHANNANQALDRIINFFPEDRRSQLLMDLSLNLKAVVSQRLIPRKDGKGRSAAIEVLLNSPTVSDLIYRGEVGAIKEVMAKSTEMGMQTFDQALLKLYMDGEISYEDALHNADSINEVRLAIKLECMRQGREDPGLRSALGAAPELRVEE